MEASRRADATTSSDAHIDVPRARLVSYGPLPSLALPTACHYDKFVVSPSAGFCAAPSRLLTITPPPAPTHGPPVARLLRRKHRPNAVSRLPFPALASRSQKPLAQISLTRPAHRPRRLAPGGGRGASSHSLRSQPRLSRHSLPANSAMAPSDPRQSGRRSPAQAPRRCILHPPPHLAELQAPWFFFLSLPQRGHSFPVADAS